jgi:hypothetical protein
LSVEHGDIAPCLEQSVGSRQANYTASDDRDFHDELSVDT